jgi:multiple sugar transport system permease protein
VGQAYREPDVLKPRLRQRGAYALLAPALAVLVTFFLVPTVWMLFVSFSAYDPVTYSSTTEGLSNYGEVINSPAVWRSVLNTAYFSVVYVPLTLLCAGGLALLLRRPVVSRPLLQAIFCSPYVVPVVGAALIWRAAYVPVNGSLDRVLYWLGRDPGPGWDGWLGQPYLAMPCIAVMCVWRDTGFFALILLAALGRIPEETYELAEVDGASRWQRFTSVTVPMSLGTLGLCVVMLVLNVQAVFQEIYVMTEDGGPANWTVNLSFLVYRKVYLDHVWGRAAALSVLLFAVTVVLILMQNRMLNKRLDWS